MTPPPVTPPGATRTPEEWEALILQFIASLCLCDHMGDVSNDVDVMLKRLGHAPEWDDLSDLMKWLHKRGVTTLYGTSLESDSNVD
jgi:hypothetical protein